jgi:hypothetical protein
MLEAGVLQFVIRREKCFSLPGEIGDRPWFSARQSIDMVNLGVNYKFS